MFRHGIRRPDVGAVGPEPLDKRRAGTRVVARLPVELGGRGAVAIADHGARYVNELDARRATRGTRARRPSRSRVTRRTAPPGRRRRAGTPCCNCARTETRRRKFPAARSMAKPRVSTTCGGFSVCTSSGPVTNSASRKAVADRGQPSGSHDVVGVGHHDRSPARGRRSPCCGCTRCRSARTPIHEANSSVAVGIAPARSRAVVSVERLSTTTISHRSRPLLGEEGVELLADRGCRVVRGHHHGDIEHRIFVGAHAPAGRSPSGTPRAAGQRLLESRRRSSRAAPRRAQHGVHAAPTVRARRSAAGSSIAPSASTHSPTAAVGSTKTPPCPTASRIAGMSLLSTGMPLACASSTTRGRPLVRYGASMIRSRRGTRCAGSSVIGAKFHVVERVESAVRGLPARPARASTTRANDERHVGHGPRDRDRDVDSGYGDRVDEQDPLAGWTRPGSDRARSPTGSSCTRSRAGPAPRCARRRSPRGDRPARRTREDDRAQLSSRR